MLIDGPDIIDIHSPKLTLLKPIGLALMHKFRFICMEILLDDSSEMDGQVHFKLVRRIECSP